VYRTDRDGSVSVTFDSVGMGVRTTPRRSQAVITNTTAVPVAARRSFLCDVPMQPFVRAAQPFVRAAQPVPPLVAAGALPALGYHRPDDAPTLPDRCSLVAATDERRRLAA
jgi:hypothetical protein